MADKPRQLWIKDEDERLIEAWASVEVRDKQGEIIPIEELEKIMPIIMDRGGLVMYRHTNKPVGKILKWEVAEHPETKKKGLKLLIKIFDHYDFDDKVWNDIKSGKLKGISFGGLSKQQELTRDEKGSTARVLRGIEGYEFSIVENPANPFATIEAVNYFAKGEDVEKYIRKRGNKWVVVDHEGNVLGEHDTYEDALRQLRAIEANKNKEEKKEVGKMEGLRDILADAMFGKPFDELTEEQREKVHETARKVRAKVLSQVELELEKQLKLAEVTKKADEFIEWFLSLPEEKRKEVEEIIEDDYERNKEIQKIVSTAQIAGMVYDALGKDRIERMSERELKNYIKSNFNISDEEAEEVVEYLMDMV